MICPNPVQNTRFLLPAKHGNTQVDMDKICPTGLGPLLVLVTALGGLGIDGLLVGSWARPPRGGAWNGRY